MGWKDHLKRLKNEVEQLIAEPGSQASQQSQAPPPQQQHQQFAPPPQQQQPTGGQPGHVYWQPQFRPDVPVTQDWDGKIGNGSDGWGNHELQHYTAEQQNVF